MFENNEKYTKGNIYLLLSLVDMIFNFYHFCNYFGEHPVTALLSLK